MRWPEAASFVAAAAFLLLLPDIVGRQPYLLHIVILTCLYAIPAIGLNLMLGYAGLVSLGHAALAGIGGYTVAILMVQAGFGFWASLPLAAAASAAVGTAVGELCLRLRSHFFMIVTLAFGLILFAVMNNWDSLTGGAAGLAGVPRPGAIVAGGIAIAFRSITQFYRLAVVATLATFLIQLLLVRSDFGRVLASLRQNETLAAFRGVDPMLNKIAVFAIGSALAGFGGALQVSYLRVAAPSMFDMVESINLVLIVVVGGAGYLIGPVLGSLLFVGLPELLRMASAYRLVLFGVVLVLVMLFARRGLAGLIVRKSPAP